MLRGFLIHAGTGICLLFMSTACRMSPATFDSNRLQCQRNLRSIENAVKTFPYDHDGQRPRTLDDALSNLGFDDAEKAARILRCPGMVGASTNGDLASRTGYYYVDWSEWFGPTNTAPASYPLIYDRYLRNHAGRGVNIVSVDGTISWDEGARALHDFVAKHPEYKLPLPN